MGQTWATRHTAEALSFDAFDADVYWKNSFYNGGKRKYWKQNTVPLAFGNKVYGIGEVEATMNYLARRVDMYDSKNGLHVSSIDAHSGDVVQDQIDGLEITWD